MTTEKILKKLSQPNFEHYIEADDIEDIYKHIADLNKVVDKLPKYVDGTPFVPGRDDSFYVNKWDTVSDLPPIFVNGVWMNDLLYTTKFYPTREAAEKALRGEE